MQEFKQLIKLICDWDEYIQKLEQEDILETGSLEQVYKFMSNMYSCSATIMLHGTSEQVVEFVKDMSRWGELAEQLKTNLLTENEDDSIRSD